MSGTRINSTAFSVPRRQCEEGGGLRSINAFNEIVQFKVVIYTRHIYRYTCVCKVRARARACTRIQTPLTHAHTHIQTKIYQHIFAHAYARAYKYNVPIRASASHSCYCSLIGEAPPSPAARERNARRREPLFAAWECARDVRHAYRNST